MTNTMTTEQILKELIKKGHSKESAEDILKIALESSNPDYVLHYWGINEKTYKK